ncbi:MAG: hypothetical protein Q8S18_06320 [Bacteroidales bacterium]|nr:hypothetical protein [Bacteroidales bacterium]
MKKNKMLFGFALIFILFNGCKKDKDPNYAELLKGTWVNTQVNGHEVLTDATFVMEFLSDNTEMYASGVQMDENNKSWQENSFFTYSVSGDMISITSNDEAGSLTQMKFKIQSIENGTITYTVPTFSINGIEFPDQNTYTCKKVTNDYNDAFTGVWYGRCTTEGAADSLYHYWEYFADGSYNYYYQDENNNWIKKSDNEGHYFLYGQLMATNYTNDLISGGTGLDYECWNFTLDGNNMVWTGLRENNIIVNYEMVKVQSPPVSLR